MSDVCQRHDVRFFSVDGNCPICERLEDDRDRVGGRFD